jgi:hypothetical protein
VSRLNRYHFAVILSLSSLVFGLLREFIIVGLLGFSATNDQLQLYLSIFYTIGLTIDAVRLACLNLYPVMALSQILLCATIVSLPFAFIIGFIMDIVTGGLNLHLLLVTIIGSYLNLMAVLLITYKQRNNSFLSAQVINVLPNFVLIPGIICCYWFAANQLVFAIVYLTSLIPVIQCALLFLLPSRPGEEKTEHKISMIKGVKTFARHFSSLTSEQIYQVLMRTAFYRFGTGYLSVFAIAIRIYSAARFILIDSFIGSKLADWKSKLRHEHPLFTKLLGSTALSAMMVMIAGLVSLKTSTYFNYTCAQICLILLFGFYFSTLVRIMYFKINHHHNNPAIVLRFSMIEFTALLTALLIAWQLHYPILLLLWLGYVAKPFTQLLYLRKHYHQLSFNLGTSKQ